MIESNADAGLAVDVKNGTLLGFGSANPCTEESIDAGCSYPGRAQAVIRAVIMTTVSGTDMDEIPDIIDTVVEQGANVFAFSRYCPTSEEKDVGIEPRRCRQLLAWCRGCPAVASGRDGNFYAADPQCWKD